MKLPPHDFALYIVCTGQYCTSCIAMLWWSADIDDYVINNSKIGQSAFL